MPLIETHGNVLKKYILLISWVRKGFSSYLTKIVKLHFVQWQTLGEIIRVEREKRNLLLRHVGAALDVDQALISKFERGERLPTKNCVVRLAKFYGLEENDLMAAWLADKILVELKNEKMALRAVTLAQQKIKSSQQKK